MGNHSLDCEFCGQDQRVYGQRCCSDNIERERQKYTAIQLRVEADTAYLARFGLVTQTDATGWRVKVSAQDVVALLKLYEGKVLTPEAP